VVEDVRSKFIDTRAREAAVARGEAIVKRLNDGEDVQAVLAKDSLSWESVAGATRDSAKLNRAISRAAFRAVPSAAGSVFYEGVPIGTGDYAIVGISNVTIPPIEQLSLSDISELRRQIAAERTAGGWRDFVDVLKSGADITLFPERL
jgi:peptidyl-prolyl cis-trans isomerase D